jgi:hypothetical protein
MLTDMEEDDEDRKNACVRHDVYWTPRHLRVHGWLRERQAIEHGPFGGGSFHVARAFFEPNQQRGIVEVLQ